MNHNAVIELMKEISQRVDKGEKSGEVVCPSCGGKVQYVYKNSRAMRAKCSNCGLSIIA